MLVGSMCRLFIIPLVLISTASCQPHWANLSAPEPVPVVTVPVVVAPMQVVPGPSQPTMTVVPGPTPMQAPFALPQATVPMVSQPVPQPLLTPSAAPSASPTPISYDFGLPAAPVPPASLQNPMFIPVGNDEVAWEQLTDVVSDYFHIANEQRARRMPELVTRGFIATAPLTGSSVLEFHRGDSADSFNRWQSTFQNIRRRATVTVDPNANGYLVGVQVDKELEDVPRPEQATAGQAILRNDNSLRDLNSFDVSATRGSGRWIYLGRDAVLEQRMLLDIQQRFVVAPQQPGILAPR